MFVDTSTVSFEIIKFERVHIGMVRAFADVVLAIDGIEIITSGWQVVEERRAIRVDKPSWRRDGRPAPAIVLPIELDAMIGKTILELYKSELESA